MQSKYENFSVLSAAMCQSFTWPRGGSWEQQMSMMIVSVYLFS